MTTFFKSLQAANKFTFSLKKFRVLIIFIDSDILRVSQRKRYREEK
ncbi:hypothetical protein HMPREF3213_01879 [Heyndrickxia coagulans]|uniref:Uncharacterized protein n=1 Tax=Heyndrickxia coagulans TaxID=1398 RepID=A0A133KQY1_HEYCO|nr:hypothetical protein HMPREF3213_01879 [Heyndrickxia coagulans]